MESVTITIINDKVDSPLTKFEDEFNFSKMDTMIHRFPAGLDGIRSRYPYIVPRFVAIGPYHLGKEHLQKMEEVKKAAAQNFCELMELEQKEVMKEEGFRKAVEEARGKYVDIMEGMEDDGHACFAATMFRDACFLLLYMVAFSSSRKKKEDNLVNPSLRRFLFSNQDSIDNDIFLLENQLPWRVLQALMDLLKPRDLEDLKAAVGSFIQDMGNAFKVRESLKPEPYVWDDENNPPPPHLLALLRRHKIKSKEITKEANTTPQPPQEQKEETTPLLPQEQKEENRPPQLPQQHKEENPKVTSISAVSPMELEEIGIKLRASQTAAFSDMDFVEGRLLSELSLAPLSLSDMRASCLVNMAAFEVCTASSFRDDPDKTAVCSYLALLAMFMVREEDVHMLRSKGLLHGPHSNKEMLTFFKTVVTHLPDSGYRFAFIMAKIEEYKHKRYIWIKLYKWFYNNIMAIIKVMSILVTLIGFYRAILSLGKHN